MKKQSIMGIRVTNLVVEETHRGVFYKASLLLEDREIGSIENPGDGSYTRVYILDPKDREKFNSKLQAYFNQLGWDTSDQRAYALDYTLSEHLIEILEDGKVSKDSMESEFLV